jgi:Mlc titration factor MtfA (ptsG expression regulator)
MFKFLKNWRQQRVIKRSEISAGIWDKAFARLPLLNHLSADERNRLRELAILFLHEKSFVGAHDFEVSEDMTLLIALQACLPILYLGIEWYSGWTTIIVYPAGFAPQRTMVDEFGVAHTVRSELGGEAWQRGPVILSWEDTEHAGIRDGHNVVIHEFIHKLDMLNGAANGFPPMHNDVNAKNWAAIFTEAYEDFQKNPRPGLNRYGATAPAEFLAVLSEVFFEKPDLLRDVYPKVYAALSLFFKQDPVSFDRAGQG